jgi:hypothetical protein
MDDINREILEASFIPKHPLVENAHIRKSRPEYSLTMIVALALLFVSIGTAGGIFGYRYWLDQEIDDVRRSLDQKEADVDMGTITSLKRIAYRLNQGTSMLDAHTALSTVFDLLNKHTSVLIALKRLSFSIEAGSAIALIEGSAPNYASLYLQWERFSGLPGVASAMIDGVMLDEESGRVLFSATLTLKPQTVQYKNAIAERERVPIRPPAENVPPRGE